MNWKSTLALVVLASAAGAWYWKGDEWGPRLGLATAPAPAASSSIHVLTDRLAADRITRIEVAAPSGDPLVLEKTDAGWRLPGNWPLRKQEVGELAALVADLRTRFQPVPIETDADLSPYGLAPSQKPVTAKVTAGGETYTLTFGEPKPAAGEPAFTRPAFVRVNDFPEVLRLGPDVLPVLRRSPDSYRRRQLFPDVDRVKVVAGVPPPAGPFGAPGGAAVETVTLLKDEVKEIEVRGPGRTIHLFGAKVPLDERVTLRKTAPFPSPAIAEKNDEPAVRPDRIADAWEIAAPARDRVDPDKLQKLLAAVPELWVEEFVSADTKQTGLDKPERTLAVTRPNGDKVVIQFGAVAKVGFREETETVPGLPPGATPPKKRVPEEYRYAKLADNPQVFTVKADRFADLFAGAADLRDPRVARFTPDEVQELTLAAPGRDAVRLTRKKGDPKADAAADRADRWLIDRSPEPVLAETSAVTDLLSQLSGLRSEDSVSPAPTLDGATTVTVVAREKRADDQPAAAARTYTLRVGKPKPDPADASAGVASAALAVTLLPSLDADRIAVQVDGWPRVLTVGDRAGVAPDASLSKSLGRPAVAFRAKRLLPPAAKLDAVTVRTAGGKFTVKSEARKDGPAAWTVTQPFTAPTDPAEADRLTSALPTLEAAEWMDDTAADLARYGLDKPKATVTLALAGAGGSHTLELGGPREGKPEVYARLDGGPVFTLPASTADPLIQATAAGLLDKVLARFPGADTLAVTRNGQTTTYAKTKAGGEWKQTAPKEAAAESAALDDLAARLAELRAERLVAAKVTPADLKKYGLDAPQAKWVASADGKPGLVLLVGSKDETGRVFVKTEAGDAVGLLPPDVSASLVAEYRPRRVWELDEARVDAIEVERGGTKFRLVRKGTGWEDPAAADDAIDAKAASELLAALGTLRAERFAGSKPADVKAAGLEKPAGTITLALRGGPKRVLQLGGPVDGTDGKQLYARVGGDTAAEAFVLSADDTARLTRDRAAYVEKK